MRIIIFNQRDILYEKMFYTIFNDHNDNNEYSNLTNLSEIKLREGEEKDIFRK